MSVARFLIELANLVNSIELTLQLQLSETITRARRYYQNISGADGFVIEGEVSKEVREGHRT